MQPVQPRQIVRERYGLLHILLLVPGAELLESDILQQAVTEPAVMALPDERHDRHPHIECITRRTAAGVRPRIKCDIHILIAMEILILHLLHADALPCDPRALQSLIASLAPLLRFEEQRLDIEHRRWNRRENARPDAQNRIIHLAEIIKAAKRHMPLTLHRQETNGRHLLLMIHIAEMRLRQPQQALREIRVILPRRIAKLVREKIIDRVKPRRIEITDAAHLDRRRAIREDGKPRPRRMTGEIEKNIDLILPNLPRGLLRRILLDDTHLCALRDPIRHRIFPALRIRIDIEPITRIKNEQRIAENPAKYSRCAAAHAADASSPPGAARHP